MSGTGGVIWHTAGKSRDIREVVHGVGRSALAPLVKTSEVTRGGKTMDNRSRPKRRCQGAFIFHRPSRDLHQQRGQFLARARQRDQLSKSFADELFVVSGAYQEPGGCDYIEDILLQRDYIID